MSPETLGKNGFHCEFESERESESSKREKKLVHIIIFFSALLCALHHAHLGTGEREKEAQLSVLCMCVILDYNLSFYGSGR